MRPECPHNVSRRAISHAATLLCAVGLCLPSLATASSGGGAVGPRPGTGETAQPTAQTGNTTVSASGDGMPPSTRASALLRRSLVVNGSLPSADAGRTVELELRGSKTHWTWQVVASAQVRSGGAFSAGWNTNHIGEFALRAVVGSGGGASAAAGLPTVTVTVYRPSVATLYGPGFY